MSESLSYLAGIIDGEGHIGIGENKAHAGRSFWYVRLSVVNTDYRLMEWLRDNFAGSIQIRQKSNERWKTSYVWYPSSKSETKRILELVLPYLILKKQQALLALELMDRTAKGIRGVPVSSDEYDRRTRIKMALQALNHKGASI